MSDADILAQRITNGRVFVEAHPEDDYAARLLVELEVEADNIALRAVAPLLERFGGRVSEIGDVANTSARERVEAGDSFGSSRSRSGLKDGGRKSCPDGYTCDQEPDGGWACCGRPRREELVKLKRRKVAHSVRTRGTN